MLSNSSAFKNAIDFIITIDTSINIYIITYMRSYYYCSTAYIHQSSNNVWLKLWESENLMLPSLVV